MPPSHPALPDDVPAASRPQTSNPMTYIQLRNRVDLNFNKNHSGLLSSLRARLPTSTSNAPSSVPARSKPSFSALLSSSTSATATATATPAVAAVASTSYQDEIEAELSSLNSTAPNSGLGFTSKSAGPTTDNTASAAQNATLRRRMGLGGRSGRDAGQNGTSSARRRAREESSDEEEGRSALGRKKTKRARAAVDVTSPACDDGQASGDIAQVDETTHEPSDKAIVGEDPAPLEGSAEEGAASQAVGGSASREPLGGKKQKKKRRKNKQNKAQDTQ